MTEMAEIKVLAGFKVFNFERSELYKVKKSKKNQIVNLVTVLHIYV